jgi:signal peptidase
VVNIILAFIIIKFLLYPGLGLVFETNLPVVAVISDSMDHKGNFDEWWGETPICTIKTPCAYTQGSWYIEHNISKEKFQEYSLFKGFVRGDVISLRGIDPEDVIIGDVIVFDINGPYPIIHRVIEISSEENETVFLTKGDHNPYPITQAFLDETHVLGSQIRGKATARIPYIGYVRLIAADFISLVSGK